MNRIFKVIWSKAKQCRVVVSEIAKSCVNVSESHKKILASGILSLLMLGGNYGISYAGFSYAYYTQLRNNYLFSSNISSTDQNIIKSGLFLGSSGGSDTKRLGSNIFPGYDNTEYGGLIDINDYYLVYNSSLKQYQIWSVTAGDTADTEDGPAIYTSYNVLDTVSEETAESLGFSYSSSTTDKEFKNNVLVDKNLNVSGDSTVTGNESVTGKSTVNSQEVTTNSEIKGNQTVDGSTTLNDKTTITKGGLDVTGGTTTDKLTVSGDSEVKGNQTVDGKGTFNGELDVKGLATLEDALRVLGDATFESDITVNGNSEVKGNQTVDGTSTFKGDVTAESNVTINKDLTVEGKTSLKDTTVDGTFEITGNAVFGGDTETKGNATFDKNITVEGDITAKGDISGKNGSFSGDLVIDGTSTFKGDVTAESNVTVKKDLTVEGDTHLKNTFIDGTLETTGNAVFGGDTETKGNATFDKDISVAGKTTTGSLEVVGDSLIGGNERVKGSFTVDGSTVLNDTLEVKKNVTFDSDFETKGNVSIGKSLTVSGPSNFKEDVSIEKNLTVQGDITSAGTISAQDIVLSGRSMNSEINKLHNDINKVGSSSAALAALHPSDFDPEDKWDFAAGVGHYGDSNSVAVGAYYHPNEDTMISLGSTMGSTPMVNMGISVKLGSGNTRVMSRSEMAKMIKSDREAMKIMVKNMIEMRKEIAELKANKVDAIKLSEITGQSFPDVPKDHWANQAVSTLKENKLVEGYPDGKFDGDKPMSRFEYAQMLYKALKRGTQIPSEELKKYEKELKLVVRLDNLKKAKEADNVQKVQKDAKQQPAPSNRKVVSTDKVKAPVKQSRIQRSVNKTVKRAADKSAVKAAESAGVRIPVKQVLTKK